MYSFSILSTFVCNSSMRLTSCQHDFYQSPSGPDCPNCTYPPDHQTPFLNSKNVTDLHNFQLVRSISVDSQYRHDSILLFDLSPEVVVVVSDCTFIWLLLHAGLKRRFQAAPIFCESLIRFFLRASSFWVPATIQLLAAQLNCSVHFCRSCQKMDLIRSK